MCHMFDFETLLSLLEVLLNIIYQSYMFHPGFYQGDAGLQFFSFLRIFKH